MSGIETRIHIHDGSATFERVQDCTAIAEHTKALSREGIHGSSEMRHAASFPMVVVEKYINNTGITFQEFMGNPVHLKTMLSDPDLAAFRVWGGKV